MPYCTVKHFYYLWAVCNNIRCISHPNKFERMNKIAEKWTNDGNKRNKDNAIGQ